MANAREYAQASGIEAVLEKCRREQRDLLLMLEARVPATGPKAIGDSPT
jgi:hypothetical protein